MSDREKLIELIRHEVVPYFAERIADHLIVNGVTVRERDEKTVILPRYGSALEATFEPGAVIGTLHIDGKTYQVYLGNMEAHQIGCASDGNHRKSHITHGTIKRKFTLIEV